MPRHTPNKERNSTYKMLSIAKKFEILHQANSPGASDRGVAKFHGISATSIRYWRKREINLREEVLDNREQNKALKRSACPAFPEMETILISWIIDQREFDLPMAGKNIKEKAKLIQEEIDPNSSFRASVGWFQKFCKRNQVSLRCKNTLNQ